MIKLSSTRLSPLHLKAFIYYVRKRRLLLASNRRTESKFQGYSVLYGDPVQLDNQNTKAEIAFAYYNDDEARFLHMTPPYMSGYATIYDEMAVLNLTIENQLITKIFWMLGAGAE